MPGWTPVHWPSAMVGRWRRFGCTRAAPTRFASSTPTRAFPLWGDARYGGGRPGQQIALWACALTLKHPTRDEELSFVCPPPDDGAWTAFRAEIAEACPEREG